MSDIFNPVAICPFLGTVLAAMIAAAVGLWQYRKMRFTNSVILSRKDYLKDFSEESAKFCIATEKIIKRRTPEDVNTQLEAAYKLKLMLNPFDYPDWWDGEIIRMINKLITHPNSRELQQLTLLLQASCIVEWKGITKEGISGIQGNKSKDRLRKETYNKYVSYCKNKDVYG